MPLRKAAYMTASVPIRVSCKSPSTLPAGPYMTMPGAHLLLHTRVKRLNRELVTVFQRWYPDLQLEEEPLAA
jgi:hypothetical protein